jgi:two-component system, NtrC family, sensor kinase
MVDVNNNGSSKIIDSLKAMSDFLVQSPSVREQIFKNILDSIGLSIFIIDRNFRFVYVNDSFAALTKESKETLLGKQGFDFESPEIIQRQYEQAKHVFTTGQPLEFEEHLVVADGTSRTVFTKLSPYTSPDGTQLLMAIMQDITGHAKARQDLLESEQRHREMIEQSPDGIYLLDIESRKIIETNKAFCQLLGYTEQQILGTSIYDIVATTSKDIDERINQLTKDKTVTGERLYRKSSGEIFPVRTSVTTITYHNRTTLSTIVHDITIHKRLEETFAEQKTFFQQMIANAAVPIFVLDTNHNVIIWNKACEGLTQIPAEKIIGTNDHWKAFYNHARPCLADFVLNNENKIIATYYDKTQQSAFVEHGLLAEGWFPCVGQQKRFLFFDAAPIYNANGSIIGAIETVLDNTQQKQILEELQLSEERFRLISENVADSILLFTAQGECLYASPSLRRFGYKTTELVGTSIYDLIHPDDLEHLKSEIATVQESFAYRSAAFRFRNHRESWADMEATISLLVNDAGSRFLAVMRDITERKKNEQQRNELLLQLQHKNEEIEQTLQRLTQMQESLVQSEKMASIGQLTAGIAHEINNPLAFVSSNLNRFAEYFKDVNMLLQQWKVFGNEINKDIAFQQHIASLQQLEQKIDLEFIEHDFEELMKHTREGADRIKNIVNQLRGFSHVTTSTDFAATDINQTIDETLTIVWNELKYKAIIHKEYGNLPLVKCNAGELKQVFVNLLVNASHAIPEQGNIFITTNATTTAVIITIHDTGSGIPHENLKKIFDPFFTTKPVGKGTGLGLWIVSTIIQNHHGSITVESEIGQGTSFHITLPIDHEE